MEQSVSKNVLKYQQFLLHVALSVQVQYLHYTCVMSLSFI